MSLKLIFQKRHRQQSEILEISIILNQNHILVCFDCFLLSKSLIYYIIFKINSFHSTIHSFCHNVWRITEKFRQKGREMSRVSGHFIRVHTKLPILNKLSTIWQPLFSPRSIQNASESHLPPFLLFPSSRTHCE